MKFQNFIEKNKYLLLIIAILLILLLGKTNTEWNLLHTIWEILLPFLIGCIMAFILNIPMRFIEKKTAPSKIEQISNFHSNHQFFINAIDRSCCHLADAVFYDPAADTKLFHAQ